MDSHVKVEILYLYLVLSYSMDSHVKVERYCIFIWY